MIEHFEILIRPIDYSADRKEFDIRIIVDGQRHGYRKVLHPGDLSSYYDQLFEIAKHTLKEQIDKHANDSDNGE